MRVVFSGFHLLLLLQQLTRGVCLTLSLGTNSLYEREEEGTVFYAQGSRAVLTCSLDGVEGAIAWYYNNVPIASEGNGTLLFGDICIEDGGWYTCATESETRRFKKDILVVVGGAPLLMKGITRPYAVQSGTRVEFPCFPQGTPQPEVKWYFVDGSERVEVFDHGSYIIDPTSKSLIIPNANEALLAGEYVCEAENIFDKDNLTYTASIIPDTTLPVDGPRFPFSSSQELVTVDQNENEIMLECATGSNTNVVQYNWFRNSAQLLGRNDASITLNRDMEGSGFYCCEIFNTSMNQGLQIFNIHCATVVFRSQPKFSEPTLEFDTSYHLPPGRRPGFICNGTTIIPLRVLKPRHYDRPKLDWTTAYYYNEIVNFTDNHGLAYLVVEVDPDNTGDTYTYRCSGNNSVGSLERNVILTHVDISEVIGDILTQSGWIPGENASSTTYMNETVLMLSFTDAQSIEDTWFMQEFVLPEGTTEFSISGRMRQSQSDMAVYPIIELSDENGDSVTVMEHPVRNSLAWQWVKTCIPSDGTSRYSIKLGLDSANVSRRQSGGGGGNVFFDDVEVRSTVMVDEPGPGPEGDNNLIIIIASSAVGGTVVLVATVILFICCCFCCCQKDGDNARPMRKLTTLVRKATHRYTLRHRGDNNTRMESPQPLEYEIPLPSLGPDRVGNDDVRYATLQGNTRRNSEGSKNGEYTSLNPRSLDEPTYYKTHGGSTISAKAEEADEGGVNMYLEVVPSVPLHGGSPLRGNSPKQGGSSQGGSPKPGGSSQGGSPKPGGSPRGGSPMKPLGLANSRENVKSGEVPSPDILDGDSIDQYEYINTDLGPAS